jgi:cystathionine gamma-synthase
MKRVRNGLQAKWKPATQGTKSICRCSLLTEWRRFFIHKVVERLATALVEKYGQPGERALLFPSHAPAARCKDFFATQEPELGQKVRIMDLVPLSEKARSEEYALISPKVSAVFFPEQYFKVAKTFWQHTGDGVSSRRAEFCLSHLEQGALVDAKVVSEPPALCKGPRRYQKKTSIDFNSSAVTPNGNTDPHDPTQFVEERFGRNLNLSLAANAKTAVRRRIAGSLTADVGLNEALSLQTDVERVRTVEGFSEDDVYLYPCGMSSIFNAHRNLMATRGPLKSIVYGYNNSPP